MSFINFFNFQVAFLFDQMNAFSSQSLKTRNSLLPRRTLLHLVVWLVGWLVSWFTVGHFDDCHFISSENCMILCCWQWPAVPRRARPLNLTYFPTSISRLFCHLSGQYRIVHQSIQLHGYFNFWLFLCWICKSVCFLKTFVPKCKRLSKEKGKKRPTKMTTICLTRPNTFRTWILCVWSSASLRTWCLDCIIFFSTVRPVASKDLLLTTEILHLDNTQQDKRRVTYKGLLIL